MPIVPISDLHDPRIAEYRNVPDGVLLREKGLFIAEGRLVVRQLLTASRLRTQSLLVSDAALRSLEHLAGHDTPFPVYLTAQALMNEIVGFKIHRGCLAIGVRPSPNSLTDLVGGRMDEPFLTQAYTVSRIVVLEGVSNVDNIGGIFRSVAALGGHAVVIGPGCGDPLYRKAIRTSIGATLRVPFASAAWPEALHVLRGAGFMLVALTPNAPAEPLEDVATDLRARSRVALVMGAEGTGLSAGALDCADMRVRIPLAPGVDSINVTMATAIALYRIA